MSAHVEVGQLVAGLRKAAGWTQERLADRLSTELGSNMEPLTITRLEGGKRPISVAELLALAAVFGIEPVELLPAANPQQAELRSWRYELAEYSRQLEIVTMNRDYAAAKVRELIANGAES